MATNASAPGAYEYSVGGKCVTEGVGTLFLIYVGECVLANELLAKTKGREMGWVWATLGFAAAVAYPTIFFSYASAKLNPAVLVAHWLYLGMSTPTFLALAASECLGAFVGAVLVWLHYAPHFKSIPEPPAHDACDALLRPRDYVGPSGARIASCDMHPPRAPPATQGARTSPRAASAAAPAGLAAGSAAVRATDGSKAYAGSSGGGGEGGRPSEGVRAGCGEADGRRGGGHMALGAAYAAALEADSNAKLSVFATRPAIHSPAFNWIAEFLGTTALVFGSLLIDERGRMLYGDIEGLWPTLSGACMGLFLFALILGFGGPTGIAANPARDAAPRLAHWLLPIPNKGPSEWGYAWIPLTAPLVGGAAGGGLFSLYEKLNESVVS